jgi:hypothetical protein
VVLKITSKEQFERANYLAAGLSVAAGIIHGIATAEYMGIWWGYSVFFIVAAAAQIAYGLLLLLQPWRYDETGGIRASGTGYAKSIYLLGAIGDAAIVTLFVTTRTIGILFIGPLAGNVEPVTLLGALAQVIHLVLIFQLVLLIRWIDTTEGRQGTTSQGNAQKGS